MEDDNREFPVMQNVVVEKPPKGKRKAKASSGPTLDDRVGRLEFVLARMAGIKELRRDALPSEQVAAFNELLRALKGGV